MCNKDYFTGRFFATLTIILNNDKKITKQSRQFIDNYFSKIEQLLLSDEESEIKDIFMQNHYLLMDACMSNQNWKILTTEDDIIDTNLCLNTQKININIKKKEENKKKIDVTQPEQSIVNQTSKQYVTYEDQHASILSNKNLLR